MWKCWRRWFLLIMAFCLFIFIWINFPSNEAPIKVQFTPKVVDAIGAKAWEKCSLTKCLDLRKCLLHPGRRLSIHVQPLLQVVDEAGNSLNCFEQPSTEFLVIRESIKQSARHEPDPSKACLILPGIDTLSLLDCPLERVFVLLDAAKSLLPPKSNFLVLNFLISRQYFHRKFPYPAIFASAQHSQLSIRPAMDFTIPLPTEILSPAIAFPNSTQKQIDLLVLFDQPPDGPEEKEILAIFDKTSHSLRVKFAVKCEAMDAVFNEQWCDMTTGQLISSLDQLISSANFLLITDAIPFPQMLFWRALQVGAVPVVLSDNFIHPFHDSIDWSRFSFHFFRLLLPHVPKILQSQHPDRIAKMRSAGSSIFTRHFSSLERIVDATIAAIEGQIVPGRARTRSQWNFGEKQAQKLPFLASAKCPLGEQQRQTVALLFPDEKCSQLLNRFTRFFDFFKANNLRILCSTQRCCELSTTLPNLHFSTFQYSSLPDDLLQILRQQTSSVGPAILLLNASHPFWYNTASDDADLLSRSLKFWTENCHSLLLFPSSQQTGADLQQFPWNSALSIVHKHLLNQFISSTSQTSCTSTRLPSALDTPGAEAVALCHFVPSADEDVPN